MEREAVVDQRALAHRDRARREDPEAQPGGRDRLEVEGVREEVEGLVDRPRDELRPLDRVQPAAAPLEREPGRRLEPGVGADDLAHVRERARPVVEQLLGREQLHALGTQPREAVAVRLAGREEGVCDGGDAVAALGERHRRVRDADVGLESGDDDGRAPGRGQRRAIGGLSPAAKTGLTSTGAPGGSCSSTRGEVGRWSPDPPPSRRPARRGARESGDPGDALDEEVERRAIDVGALVAVEALLRVDDEQNRFVTAEQAHASTVSDAAGPVVAAAAR